ncbi:MAG: hypothetical protein Q9219_006056 [cf. Caloplaca sp. 3 TL-2023]
MEPRPQQPTLPSLPIFGRSEGDPQLDSNPIGSRPTPETTPGHESWSDIPSASKPAFDINAVMRKGIETLHEQLRANGYDPNNLPIRDPPVNNRFKCGNGQMTDNRNGRVQSNPYQERADQIGLSHRIPGIGHLGDFLTPPDWKFGDEPISPNRADQLRRGAYDEAKKKLDESIAKFKHLKGTQFQEASDVNDEEWQNQIYLNERIFEERVKIYQTYQAEREFGGQMRAQQVPGLNLPPPIGVRSPSVPPLGAGPAYYSQPNRPVSRALSLSQAPNGFNRPGPSPGMLSPSLLDPHLIPGTTQAMIQAYHKKRLQIEQLQQENELRLHQYFARYGPHLGLGYIIAPQPFPQPYPRQNPHQAYTHSGADKAYQRPPSQDENQQLATRHFAPLHGINPLCACDEPNELAITPNKPGSHDAMKSPTEQQSRAGAIEAAETPSKSKKKTPTKKASPKKSASRSARQKREPWYAAEFAARKLPTSVISDEALQAGLNYDPKNPPPKRSQPPKRRRRGSEPVPVPAVQMSTEKIKKLFEGKMPVRYTGPGRNPYLPSGEPTSKVLADLQGEDGKKRAVSSWAGTSRAKALEANGSHSVVDLTEPEPRCSACPSDASTESSEDDPADETYGTRRKSDGARLPRKGRFLPNKRVRREE